MIKHVNYQIRNIPFLINETENVVPDAPLTNYPGEDFWNLVQKYTKKTEPAKIGLRYVLKCTDVYKKCILCIQIHVQKRTLCRTTYFVAAEMFSAEMADENVRWVGWKVG